MFATTRRQSSSVICSNGASILTAALFTTAAPPAASERAMARPMLRAPPVTSATLPASSLPGFIPTLDMLLRRFLMTYARQPDGERREGDHQPDQQEHAGDERHASQVDIAHGR